MFLTVTYFEIARHNGEITTFLSMKRFIIYIVTFLVDKNANDERFSDFIIDMQLPIDRACLIWQEFRLLMTFCKQSGEFE